VFAGAAGWVALSQSDTDISALAYAVLFGLVAGMMVYISFRELLRTAYKYVPLQW
jgi:zinc transporter ZupT